MNKIIANYGFIGDVKVQSKIICDCLGYGKNNVADKLLLETACSETGIGNIEDKSIGAGMGICQFDKIPFYDIKQRSAKYRDKILEDLKVDIELIEWEHIRYNTFLSLLFCRLHYKPIPKEIPSSLQGRAKYWKEYYNTKYGKGTVEHYIKMVQEYYPIDG